MNDKRERPILFNAAMVRAILDGRKTVTRRPIKLPSLMPSTCPGYAWDFRDRRGQWNSVGNERLLDLAPYQRGDLLWVRETFWQLRRRGAINEAGEYDPGPWLDRAFYGPDPTNRSAGGPEYDAVSSCWIRRPSIHMPRWASRITLEVIDVRLSDAVELDEAEARREGFDSVDAFREVWRSLYGGARQCWRVAFRRVQP